jgi:hypothetical protein
MKRNRLYLLVRRSILSAIKLEVKRTIIAVQKPEMLERVVNLNLNEYLASFNTYLQRM